MDVGGDIMVSRPSFGTRGQTTLDFAIGVGVFLISVAFVLSFVPGMIQPFETNTQEEMSVADRVATQLAKSMLGGPSPYVLGDECTVEFFRTDATAPGGVTCPFNENDLGDTGTLPGRLGIDAEHDVQVRIQGDIDGDGTHATLCWDAAGGKIIEQGNADCDGSDTIFDVSTGTPPTSTGSVNTGERVVSLRKYDVRILVQAW